MKRQREDYITTKCKVMKQIGLSKQHALRQYLEDAVRESPDEAKRIARIDILCRQLLVKYYEGDRTFVGKDLTGKSYYDILKAKYPKADTLYEDTIIRLVGYEGLKTLRENHLIETCAKFGDRKLYAL